jgi:two-component system chemotaxis response regulator CheY
MKHCLIVDDSRVVRTVAHRIITDLSFTVSEAGDGASALKQCQSQMPDVILLDWNMPVMNGMDFLVSLRRSDGGKAPVVILCTNEKDSDHISEAIRAGADEYIMKPFDADIVRSKFDQLGLV